MNIDDVSIDHLMTIHEDHMWPMMYKRQQELAEKYSQIEMGNGFYYPHAKGTLHIDNSQLQRWFKDMMWRVVEEVAEAYETVPEEFSDPSIPDWWRGQWEESAVIRHFLEELADSLHFFLELSIVAGISCESIISMRSLARPHAYISDSHNECAFRFIVTLGIAGNVLKNKPWKITQMPTDGNKFILTLLEAWRGFFDLIKQLNLTTKDIFLLYMKKSDVNLFRIGSNY